MQGSSTGETPPASTQRPEHLGSNVPGCVDPRCSQSRGLGSGGLGHPHKTCQGCSGPESTPTCPQCRGQTLWACPLSPFVRSIAGRRAKRSTEATSAGPSSQPVAAPLPAAALPVASSSRPTCSFPPTLLGALVYGPNTFPTFLLWFKTGQLLNSPHPFSKNCQWFCLRWDSGEACRPYFLRGVETRAPVASSSLDRTGSGHTGPAGLPHTAQATRGAAGGAESVGSLRSPHFLSWQMGLQSLD